jgi:hypothetical protein
MEATMNPKAKTSRVKKAAPTAAQENDRVTYRELRNTPGRVWERLADNEILTLVADGGVKALLIPVRDGNARDALDAYNRGRAMMALASLRRTARENGTSRMTLAEINEIIRETRAERRAKRGR